MHINSNNASYNQSIEDGKKIANKLDYDELIDKDFINVMDNFINNYTNIFKYMDLIKKEQFPLIDDALNGSYFDENVKKSFDLDNLGINVFNEIRNENDKYLDDVNNIVNNFLNENKKDLDELFLKLSLLFSEDSLKDLADNLNVQFNDYFKKFESNMEKNKNLGIKYFEKMTNLIQNNTLLLEYLKRNLYDDPRFPYILSRSGNDYIHLGKFVDSIKTKIISKISDVFPDFPNLDFIENNINLLKDFYDKLNKHISDDVFNNYYFPIINEFKNKEINFNNNYLDFIESNYNKVKS